MKLTRRTFAKAGAAVAVVAIGGARESAAPALVVFDRRIARSALFAAGFAGAKLDVAGQEARRWQSLRDTLPSGRIVGLTRWSDYVIVRGFAEDQRLRLRREQRVGSLFKWELG